MLNVISVVLSTFLVALFTCLMAAGMTQVYMLFGLILSFTLFMISLYFLIDKVTSDTK
jgi:hypothetical protein